MAADDEELLVEVRADLTRLRSDMDRARKELNDLRKSGNDAGAGMQAGFNQAAASAFKLLGGLVALDTVIRGFSKLVEVNREFAVLNASLITATGSSEDAAVAFSAIQDFARNTPYDLKQATAGFVQLVNLGLTPSERALQSYGDTASAMGKDLSQMVEAVADAATGEFERLKEFGIKAKNNGDTIAFTFRGVTESVKNDAASIEEYLIRLGENNFAGAMAERMATLDGAISNLGDSVDQMFLSFGQAGASNALTETITGINTVVNDLTAAVNSGQLGALFDGLTASFFGWGDDIITSMPIITKFIRDEMFGWGESGADTASFLIKAFKEWPENVRAFVKIITTELAYLVDKAGIVGDALAKNLNPTDGEWVSYKKLREQIDIADAARMGSITTILNERDAAVAAAEYKIELSQRLRAEYDKEQEARAKATADTLAQFKATGAGKGGQGEPDKGGKQKGASGVAEENDLDVQRQARAMERVMQDRADAQAEAENYLNDLREQHMSEMELLDAQHEAKMERLAGYREDELIGETEFKEAQQIMAEGYMAKRRAMLEKQYADELKLMNMTKTQKVQSVASELNQIIGTAGAGNRKLFEIQKAARLAEAAISIPSTVIDAYRHGNSVGGPVLGAAFGATALAAQLVQLRNIQSATFGGGVSGAAGGGGGATPAAGAAETPTPQATSPSRYVNVSLYGDEGGMYSKSSVRKLIERIGEEVKDGAILGVS